MAKVKKPIYKRIWFWIVLVVLVIAIGGVATSRSDNGGEKVEQKSSAKTKEKESDKFYKIGDTVQVGDVEYTLKHVELTDERNEFDDKKPAQVVKISYTVKNNSDKDIPVGADVNVYGSDNKKSDSYANEHTMGSVASGKEMECITHFGLNQTGDIEIHFSPLVSFENPAKFKAHI